nr:hypothetical protein [Desulfobacterales bacterium]
MCPGNGCRGQRSPRGSTRRISIFSFYATKMITTGEGGMVVTSDSKPLQESVT